MGHILRSELEAQTLYTTLSTDQSHQIQIRPYEPSPESMPDCQVAHVGVHETTLKLAIIIDDPFEKPPVIEEHKSTTV